MSVNKEAVQEIYKRDGFQSAGVYLTTHENMSSQEAIDYLHNQILFNANSAASPTYNVSKENGFLQFYHECCNTVDELDDYVHECNTTISQKVKSWFKEKYYGHQ